MEWIGTNAGRVVIVRNGTNGDDTLLLDDPGRLRFRQPVPAQRAGELSLREVREVEPGELDGWCGWYAGPGRRLLLTQIPERSFGEPMVLIGDGDAVLRAYPVGPRQFIRADGVGLSLVTAEHGGPAIRLGEDDAPAAVLPRDERLTERPVEFRVGDDLLAATLITPAGGGPHPAAVVVHGAGFGQRDSCRLLVEPVLAAGVAVLLYDKRGHGRSTGSPDVTIFDQARAAAAGLDRLADEPDIDSGRLGLIGFSNGMWAVPMVAADRPDLAFVAGIGSPGVSMAEAEVHRRSKVLREAGLSTATVDAATEAWRSIFAIVGAGTADAALTTRLSGALDRLRTADDLARYEVPDYARENPRLSAVPPLQPVHELVAALSGQPDREVGHDPAEDYARLRCPLFLQWGADDTSIPVEVSVARISAAVTEPTAATLRVYPHVEHLLNSTVAEVTGISAEQAMYGFHEFRFAPRVREELRDWLRTTLGGSGTGRFRLRLQPVGSDNQRLVDRDLVNRDLVDRLRTAYDGRAADRDRTDKESWKVAERDAFLTRLRDEGCKRLLEIGAGSGQDSAFFQRNGLDVLAVDLSPAMVARCREKGIDARVMDFRRPDLPPESFDAVYALNCLLHVPNSELPEVLSAIHTLLRPGGLFFLGVYGGVQEEGIAERDWHDPPRFFSFRTDEQIQRFAARHFDIFDFHVVRTDQFRFQSLTLRRP